LASLVARSAELREAGVDLIAINVDAPADEAKAALVFEGRIRPGATGEAIRTKTASEGLKSTIDALLVHIRDQTGDWPLPMSLLVDGDGALQVVYLGKVRADQLVADAKTYVQKAAQAASRGAFQGRWYFRIPRDYPGLARELELRGQLEAAAFYKELTPPAGSAP